MEKLFDTLSCPEGWRVGFAGFCLNNDADLWCSTLRNRQYEFRFGCSKFMELLKNCFYPLSLQKGKEDEFVHLQQGKISTMEYASKVIELSRFSPIYVTDKKLRMN